MENKSDSPDHLKIHALLPVVGDWFVVYGVEDDRWFIDRVLALAFVNSRHMVNHVRPILADGMEHDADG